MKIMILKPRVSEKAYSLSQRNVYVFSVPSAANKQTVASAVAEQFGVTVTDVNIVVQKGKQVRTIRLGNRRARPSMGQRSDLKKAYVTLKAGDHIAVFDTEEEPKTDDKKTKKAKETK